MTVFELRTEISLTRAACCSRPWRSFFPTHLRHPLWRLVRRRRRHRRRHRGRRCCCAWHSGRRSRCGGRGHRACAQWRAPATEEMSGLETSSSSKLSILPSLHAESRHHFQAHSTHLARRRDVHEGHGRRVAIVAAAGTGQKFDALDAAKPARRSEGNTD